MRCEGCGEIFMPSRGDQRVCSRICRQRLYDACQRALKASEIESVRCSSGSLPAAEKTDPEAVPRPVLVLYTRAGFPDGLSEGRDGDGLPAFYDEDGVRLFRVWGPNMVSDLQLPQMGLDPTALGFLGGKFYQTRLGTGRRSERAVALSPDPSPIDQVGAIQVQKRQKPGNEGAGHG